MSAAATAAGYLYASGRLRGRAQRDQEGHEEHREHAERQKPAARQLRVEESTEGAHTGTATGVRRSAGGMKRSSTSAKPPPATAAAAAKSQRPCGAVASAKPPTARPAAPPSWKAKPRNSENFSSTPAVDRSNCNR